MSVPTRARAAAAARGGGAPASDQMCTDDKERALSCTVPSPSTFQSVSFLHLGQRFSGSQTVNGQASKENDEWRVNVVIQGINLNSGTICGSMEALDVPKAVSPVVTFWKGEIIDNVNYFFTTGRWDAELKVDVDHWRKFVAFEPLQPRVRRDKGNSIDLSQKRYIFMRWKEIFFVSPGEDCGLTIAGFYYVCMDRQTGAILGYYYDPQSQPYQRLQLNATYPSEGGATFEDYEFN